MKPSLKAVLAIISLTLFASFIRYDSDDLAQRIFDRFKEYSTRFPNEKVFLQTDRTYYAAGSDIWYKAFVLDANSFRPSSISSVVHTELISPSGKIIMANKSKVDGGSAHGDFEIPLNLPEGRYLLRAYTKWMQNGGSAFFFKKEIEIFNPEIAGLDRGYSFQWAEIDGNRYLEADMDLRRMLYDSLGAIGFQYTVVVNNEVYELADSKSDQDGNATVTFRMPTHIDVKSLQIQLSARDNNWEYTNSVTVPLTNQLDLQFFPEGGYLVSGIESKVAFKVVNEFGKGVNVEGVIIDQTEKVVANFKSLHNGMGVLNLKPQAGQLYYARISGTQENFLYQLPESTFESVAMSVDNSDDEVVKVKIRSTQEAVGESGSLVLVAQSRNNITFMAKSEAGSYFQTEIPKSRFPSGITQLTLFDGNGVAKVERLIFVDHGERLNIEIASNKERYLPREKVQLTITTTGSQGKRVPADLALSVVDAEEINQQLTNQQDIYSYLLLSSDLSGRIENPDFYFSGAPNSKEALDILMLTQGWRRFVWKEVMDDSIALPEYFVEKGLYITGTLYKGFRDKPATDGQIILLYTGDVQGIAMAAVNEEGRFSFDGSGLHGDVQMIFQGRNKKGKPYVDVVLDSIWQPASIGWVLSAIEPDFNEKVERFLAASKSRREADLAYNFDPDKVLDEVIIRGRKLPEEREDRRRGQIYSAPSNRLEVADIPGAEDLQNPLYLLYRIPGVQVNPDPFNPSILIRGVGTIMGSTAPLILIDGMVTDIQAFINTPISTIETIDVLKGARASMFGSRGSNGVIAVYTKEGSTTTVQSRGITRFPFKGFYQAREFYAPKYDQESEEHIKPDLRASLYWNPEVRTDSLGQATVEFFNADKITTFRANAQGASAEGQVGAVDYSFKSSRQN